MRTETFSHNGASISVRERLGDDDLDIPFIANMMAEYIAPDVPLAKLPGRVYIRCLLLAAIIRQTAAIEGDIGIVMPGPNAPDESIQAFYEALFRSADHRELLELWTGALNRVNKPPARDLHETPKDPEPSSDVEQQSETSIGQSTVALLTRPDTPALLSDSSILTAS